MTESHNINDLRERIDWEGSIPALLNWGFQDIEDYDVPDSLKDAWDDMLTAYREFENYLEDVEAEIRSAINREEEE